MSDATTTIIPDSPFQDASHPFPRKGATDGIIGALVCRESRGRVILIDHWEPSAAVAGML